MLVIAVRSAILWLALGAFVPGCRSTACDEVALREAADGFAARTDERRRVGFAALRRACSGLPSMLLTTLEVELDVPPGIDAVRAYDERGKDPAWQELRGRTCTAGPAMPGDARGTRMLCDLDRYGLLGADDLFVDRDLGVFMLHEWLIGRGVEPTLREAIARPLLTTSAGTPELEMLCIDRDLVCDALVHRWGLQPPRSTMDWPLQQGPLVQLRAGQILVDRAPVVALDGGRRAADAFVEHRSPALQRAIAASIADADPRVLLAADHATPFATITDTLFTATHAGVTDVTLVVDDGYGLRGIPITGPREWLPQDPNIRHDRPLQFLFTISNDAVQMLPPGGEAQSVGHRERCDAPPGGCHDLAGIAAFVTAMKDRYPHETVATFRLAGDVSLQAAIAVIDAVRGETCRLADAQKGAEVPQTCKLWQTIVDADPPLH